jgi:hypothetical protein
LKARLIHSNEIDRQKWDRLVSESGQGSIFTESGYLDIILTRNWSGIEVYDDSELIAVMPVKINRKWGFTYALQPILAKYWGIVFMNRNYESPHKEYSFKKDVVKCVIDCIPKNIISFNYNFHPEFDYPLPFFWRSCTLRTSYTYILDARGKNESNIFNGYSSQLKNSIRTAQKNDIRIVEDNSTSALTSILEGNRKSGKTIFEPGYYDMLNRIIKDGQISGKSFSLTALDKNENKVASSIYLKDNHTVYALIHTMAKSFSKTDGLSLLVHQAVLRAAAQNCKFDFLGSMIEPVEAFNRRFGASPVPYLNISKKSRLLHVFGK